MIASARMLQPAWAEGGVRKRLAIVRRVRNALAGRAGPTALEARLGDADGAREALVAEVLPLLDACRFLEREAASILAPRRLGRRGRPAWLRGVDAEIRREPYGVVLVVGSSNYPLFLPGAQAIQALVAGNCVLWKPGAGGTPAALSVRRALLEAGLDEAALQVLPESPAAVAEAVEAGVDKVTLTGSARTGREVLGKLATAIVPATMELSGCDAAFVLETADVDLVVRVLAFGLRWNGSETCIAPRRAFVAEPLVRRVEAGMAAAAASVPVRGCAPETSARLLELLREATDGGGRIIAGGAPRETDGAWPATVVTDTTPAMRLLSEDIFAPVLSIVKVRDAEEALRFASACPYALGASIFGDETSARALAARVRAGTVVVNDAIVPTADPRLPFGGRGKSGFGVTRGAAGLLEMTQVKCISVRRGPRRHLEPLHPGDEHIFEGYLRAAHGSSFAERLRGAIAMLRAVVRRRRKGPAAPAGPGVSVRRDSSYPAGDSAAGREESRGPGSGSRTDGKGEMLGR